MRKRPSSTFPSQEPACLFFLVSQTCILTPIRKLNSIKENFLSSLPVPFLSRKVTYLEKWHPELESQQKRRYSKLRLSKIIHSKRVL